VHAGTIATSTVRAVLAAGDTGALGLAGACWVVAGKGIVSIVTDRALLVRGCV
jgi:hypothetical protein